MKRDGPKYLTVVAGVLAFLLIAGCEKVDKANQAVEKAKNLKTEMDKTVDKVKKGLADKTEELARKAAQGSGRSDGAAEDGQKDAD
jgi:outer membrane murein-binding lipoprotein Lpp